MPVALRPSVALEPIQWPTGEDVAVKRPNLYAAEVWDQVTDAMAKGDAKAIRESLVEFVAMVCPARPSSRSARSATTSTCSWWPGTPTAG
jgi:hypothetical protein